MRTIRVTGKGEMKLRPDMTRISITLSGLFGDYAETLRHSAEDTEKMKDLLGGLGFAGSDLKTLDLCVDTEYESYREGNEYRQRLAGYRYRHMMKIEFDSDNGRLGRILYALANSELLPEFSIAFTVKDREAAKNALLRRAVEDAKEKALVLAEASGAVLGDIQLIDYSRGEIPMEVRPMNRMMAPKTANSAADSYSISAEPDDIGVSDTVTVVWEIS
jgi:uncharacterized protein YggE